MRVLLGGAFAALACVAACVDCVAAESAASSAARPNIVFILADDLGYGALGCYGQEKIATPHVDRLAAAGMRFTQHYAGSHVCMPARSTLMTGLHTGHTPIRANQSEAYLHPDDVTVAEVLTAAGYRCGLFGKWGLGAEDTPGHPNRQGFAEFFGFLRQEHAHFYYPYFLWHNAERYALPENEGRQQARYAHDEVHARALEFIRASAGRPFFCYAAYTIPHVELVVPEDSLAPYRGRWPETPLPDPREGYIGADEPYATMAGMISRLDRHVGEIVALLEELGIADETLLLFTSDNGGQGQTWQPLTDFFQSNGPLRGYKATFYEGGIRVPLVAYWPGTIAPGTTSDRLSAFWDFMPTAAELAGAPSPATDGISLVPTLLGKPGPPAAEYLYWEHPGRGAPNQAIRAGDWKLIATAGQPVELYNLADDIAETRNLAEAHPDVVDRLKHHLTDRTERRPYAPEPRRTGYRDYVR